MEQNIHNNEIKFTSKAPAKIIISGEHAVVYNSKAISCAVDLYATCEFKMEMKNPDYKSNFIILNLIDIHEVCCLYFNQINRINEYIKLFENKSHNSVEEFLQSETIETFLSEFDHLKLEKNSLYFAMMWNIVFSYFIYDKNILNIDFGNILKDFFSNYTLEISISLNFAHGAGLGSSAALNVSLGSCLLKLANFVFREYISIKNEDFDSDENVDKNFLFLVSYLGEKFFHSKPSGIDNITSIHKGMILFSSFKNFDHISPSKIFLDNIKIFLIDTKIRRDTKTFIQKVKDFKMGYEKVFLNSIDSINCVAEEIHKNIINENINIEQLYSNLIKLFAINQNLLNIIQVSHQEINRIINLFSSIDIPAKLTGGGGGGYMIAFVNKEKYDIFLETSIKNCINAVQCQIVH